MTLPKTMFECEFGVVLLPKKRIKCELCVTESKKETQLLFNPNCKQQHWFINNTICLLALGMLTLATAHISIPQQDAFHQQKCCCWRSTFIKRSNVINVEWLNYQGYSNLEPQCLFMQLLASRDDTAFKSFGSSPCLQIKQHKSLLRSASSLQVTSRSLSNIHSSCISSLIQASSLAQDSTQFK